MGRPITARLGTVRSGWKTSAGTRRADGSSSLTGTALRSGWTTTPEPGVAPRGIGSFGATHGAPAPSWLSRYDESLPTVSRENRDEDDEAGEVLRGEQRERPPRPRTPGGGPPGPPPGGPREGPPVAPGRETP